MTRAYPEFRSARCVRYRFRYSECSRCSDACPHLAITTSDEGVAINPAQCQNCGLCSAVCKTAALTPGNLSPIDLLRTAVKQDAFSFACAPSGHDADARVPCLGALDAVFLAYLAKRGIGVELRGTEFCGDCAHAPAGSELLAGHLEAVSALAVAARGEEWAQIARPRPERSTRMPRGEVSTARRQLFRRFIGRGVDAMRDSAPSSDALPAPEKAIRAGPYAGTDLREVLRIVGGLPAQQAFVVHAHDALPALELELQPGCTACEACFRACPTGALAIEESDEDWALSFDFDRCVGCEVCMAVCQPRVLRCAEHMNLKPGRPRRTLHALGKQRCSVCDRFFVSPEPQSRCAVCVDDDDAFGQIYN